MMFGHPVWDPETNKKSQLDHVFIICGGEITKQAKEFLAQALDREGRRHVLFVDRAEILDLAVGTNLRLPEV
jgi:glycerol dehydrogenase-like iron-containing ADH family enzyme